MNKMVSPERTGQVLARLISTSGLPHASRKLPKGSSQFLATIAACLLCALCTGKAEATTYYVSPSGNNTSGTSWQTAWTGFSNINWQILQTGDSIYLDGGTSSITYSEPLIIPPASVALQIQLAPDSGHNGQVIIDGSTSTAAAGVQVQSNSSIYLAGLSGAHPITIQNWSKNGLQATLVGSDILNSSYLNVHNCKVGVNYLMNNFTPSYVNSCVIHDNSQVNILATTTASISGLPSTLYVQNCWVYSSSYAPSGSTTAGIAIPGGLVNNCVIGPGLAYGFFQNSTINVVGNIQLTNCLFLDATVANLSLTKSTFNPPYVHAMTSFMTPLNPYSQSHDCIQIAASNQSPDCPSDSIAFGGRANTPVQGKTFTLNNYEYKVTGNTTYLASQQINPQFVASVGAYANNVPVSVLIDTDFSIQAGSPAFGAGSLLTSVAQLLDSIGGTPNPAQTQLSRR